MTSEHGLETLFPDLEKHPLTAVGSKELPGNHWHHSDFESRSLSVHFGQRCEKIAALWCSNQLNNLKVNPDVFASADEIRRRIKPQLEEKKLIYIHEVSPIYQDLTSPPALSGNSLPDWEPLQKLWCELDILFPSTQNSTGLKLVELYNKLGSSNINSGLPNERIRFLVESALIVEKMLREPSPFSDHVFIPNVHISNIVQFDAMIVQPNTSADPFNYEAYFENGKPWSAWDIKLDFRVRNTTGPNNTRINKSPFKRHVKSFKNQITNIAENKVSNFYLPKSIVYFHPRGTLENVTHYVRIDRRFLSDWKLSIELAQEQDLLSSEELETSKIMLGYINDRIHQIDSLSESKKSEQVFTGIQLGFDGQPNRFKIKRQRAIAPRRYSKITYPKNSLFDKNENATNKESDHILIHSSPANSEVLIHSLQQAQISANVQVEEIGLEFLERLVTAKETVLNLSACVMNETPLHPKTNYVYLNASRLALSLLRQASENILDQLTVQEFYGIFDKEIASVQRLSSSIVNKSIALELHTESITDNKNIVNFEVNEK